MEKGMIRKSNALIEGRFSISLMEMRIFLSLITQIKFKDKAFKEYRIYYSDIAEKMDMDIKGALYDKIRKSAKSLTDKTLMIETERGHLIASFFSSVELYRGESYMDICFDPKLKPYLLDLKKRFTSYDIQNVIRCRAIASIRIYELLKQYEKLEDRRIEIDTLKEILGMNKNQYKIWGDFRRWVIEPARKELKKYSDIYFTYETKKRGRRIHAIVFHIHKKKQRRLNFDKDESESPYLSYEEIMENLKELEDEPPEPYKP